MKRKTTDLEQRLINNGYRLTTKEYGGRKSEKTLCYIYEKGEQYVRLNYKRNMVLSLGISNYSCKRLTKVELESLRIKLYNIEQDTLHDNEEWANVELKEENGQIIPLELPKESD